MPSASRLCPGDQERRRCGERRREQPEHDLGPAAEHRVVGHRSQVDGDNDEDESEQRSTRADQRDAEVVPGSGVIGRIHLRNTLHGWTLTSSAKLNRSPFLRGAVVGLGWGTRWRKRVADRPYLDES
jgi:hypothetical protein